jgi:putative endonuclease
VKDHKDWVYIVGSLTGTLYIGMTNNIARRMWEHKSGEFEGFASEYGCKRLVYYESFDDVRKAIDREKQLKGWRRSKKIALIEALNPRWQDLAEKWGAEMLFPGQSIREKIVILSGAAASRSEAAAESEGPRKRRALRRTHQGILTTRTEQ